MHPYGDSSSVSPDVLHPLSNTIGIADYAKLVALLGTAFDGTGQPGSKEVPPRQCSFHTFSLPIG